MKTPQAPVFRKKKGAMVETPPAPPVVEAAVPPPPVEPPPAKPKRAKKAPKAKSIAVEPLCTATLPTHILVPKLKFT